MDYWYSLFTSGLKSQVPEMFNYQAVARATATGEPMQNASLSVRIAILSSVDPDIVLWEEEHSVNTNEFGLLLWKLEIQMPQILEDLLAVFQLLTGLAASIT